MSRLGSPRFRAALDGSAWRRAVDVLFSTAMLAASAQFCFGEWAQTVNCPAGRVYQDIRKYAGREEFCELVLPGSLVVKDGAYRSWFSEGHPGADGAYKEGREVGLWKECDRFDRCRQTMHKTSFPAQEKRAAFKPEIPVSYASGQYQFDFASCRSTWISRTNGSDPISLNILGGSPYRCEIAYIPQSVLEHGGKGDYFCRIPYSVGVRGFKSLDLIRELPLSGLPQFCHSIYPTGEALLVQDSRGFPVATTVDVESADTEAGPDVLTLKLNKDATEIVKQVAEQAGRLTTLLCFHELVGPRIVRNNAGSALFSYLLSSNSATARKQRACAAEAFARKRDQ